jgi:hypothetical protein
MSPDAEARTVTMHTALSTAGTIAGPAAYVSPEQAVGEARQ